MTKRFPVILLVCAFLLLLHPVLASTTTGGLTRVCFPFGSCTDCSDKGGDYLNVYFRIAGQDKPALPCIGDYRMWIPNIALETVDAHGCSTKIENNAYKIGFYGVDCNNNFTMWIRSGDATIGSLPSNTIVFKMFDPKTRKPLKVVPMDFVALRKDCSCPACGGGSCPCNNKGNLFLDYVNVIVIPETSYYTEVRFTPQFTHYQKSVNEPVWVSGSKFTVIKDLAYETGVGYSGDPEVYVWYKPYICNTTQNTNEGTTITCSEGSPTFVKVSNPTYVINVQGSLGPLSTSFTLGPTERVAKNLLWRKQTASGWDTKSYIYVKHKNTLSALEFPSTVANIKYDPVFVASGTVTLPCAFIRDGVCTNYTHYYYVQSVLPSVYIPVQTAIMTRAR